VTSWNVKWFLHPEWNDYRRDLITVLDFLAACAIAQLFLDYPLASIVAELRKSAVVDALSFIPSRAQLSLLFTVGMALLILYRVKSQVRASVDRGMFVLGCGVVSGFMADKLKLAFGRPPPDVFLIDGSHGFHFFAGGAGLDSFPSSHAAIAAAIAGASSALWPAYRRIFLGLALLVAMGRFINGAHYLSDVLLGCAIGLSIVLLMRALFYQLGIPLVRQESKRR
jgi:membrane-associated phospholipid phosphatase